MRFHARLGSRIGSPCSSGAVAGYARAQTLDQTGQVGNFPVQPADLAFNVIPSDDGPDFQGHADILYLQLQGTNT